MEKRNKEELQEDAISYIKEGSYLSAKECLSKLIRLKATNPKEMRREE